MTSTQTPLPHWDVTSFFPSLDSREVAVAHEATVADLARLVALYDRHDVRGGEPRPLTEEDQAAVDEVIGATNALLDQVRTLSAYLASFVTTDAANDRAAGLRSRLQTELTDLSRLTTRFDAWVARLGAEALVAASPAAADHAHALQRAETAATHQMSEAEEGLAADLRLSGSGAWARLHGEITARLVATVAATLGHPEPEVLPITVVRGLAHDPDPARRRAAYQAELVAWESVSVPLAAALNGAKGETNVLNRRRGWADALEPALFTNGVDRATLEAMQAAVDDSLADFRRYLRAKARVLGHAGGLPWWDLFAPVGTAATDRVDWADALDRVRTAFGSYSPSLAGLAERASRDGWIDAEPRGRQGGRCLLHAGAGGRVAGHVELRRITRQRAHPGPRAGPRLPQHQPGRAHAHAAPDADGAGRDGQHLLRDDHGGGRPGRHPGRAAPGPARHRPAGRLPGGGGHPQPLPVRARAVRAARRARPCR